MRPIIQILNSPFNWSFVTSNDVILFFLYWTQNIVHSPFSQLFSIFPKMSQSSKKATTKGINVLEDKSGKKAKAPKSKKVDMEKNGSKMGTHVGTYVIGN